MNFFQSLSDQELLARCIYGEARGESEEGRIAVAHIVMNRMNGKAWFGKTLRCVILKPYQFSCFNTDDPNHAVISAEIITGIDMEKCRMIADDALSGRGVDPTSGATHYHAESYTPKWVRHERIEYICQIGRHLFYRELN